MPEQIIITMGISSGLAYLHSRQLLHRDLTTNNVMLTDVHGTHAKITDVGCSRLLHGKEAMEMTAVPGNQRYMAPETFKHEAAQHGVPAIYGFPADIFSLGVTILAMCACREPADVVTIAVEGRYNDLDSLGEHHSLRQIIMACIHDNPLQRPNASELVERIVLVRENMQVRGLSSREQLQSSVSPTSGPLEPATRLMQGEREHLEDEIASLRDDLMKKDRIVGLLQLRLMETKQNILDSQFTSDAEDTSDDQPD